MARTSALGQKKLEGYMPHSAILAQKKINWTPWSWGLPSCLGRLQIQGLSENRISLGHPVQLGEIALKNRKERKEKWNGTKGVTQLVQYLPNMYMALGLIPSTEQN